MNEVKAREILKDMVRPDNALRTSTDAWVSWDLEAVFIDNGGRIEEITPKTIALDGEFSAEQLRAFAWWIENKKIESI